MLLLALVIGIIGCIVFLEKGERKIPVQYSRRVVGNKMYAAQSTYIPFKINTVGVMPVIFASVVIGMPLSIASFLSGYFPSLKIVVDMLVQGTVLHSVLTFLLIIFFSFVYTALVFNPDELADNMKKSGGFIPGLRPGKQTAEFFNFILTRIGLSGAVYLAFLALLPTIVKAILQVPFYLTGLLSGTSLLIVVGVAIDTAAQVESYLIEYRYEGFLRTGRFKRRALRQ
jgi:preprotein translocase subunit SecY